MQLSRTDEQPKTTVPGVVVEYRKSLADLISLGGYDWVDGEINPERFPHDQSCATQEVEFNFVYLGRYASEKEVLAEHQRFGLLPANMPELLAIGAAHPDLQRQMNIAALGARWLRPDGRIYVPILDGEGGGRRILLAWNDPDYEWGPRIRFLAVRK